MESSLALPEAFVLTKQEAETRLKEFLSSKDSPVKRAGFPPCGDATIRAVIDLLRQYPELAAQRICRVGKAKVLPLAGLLLHGRSKLSLEDFEAVYEMHPEAISAEVFALHWNEPYKRIEPGYREGTEYPLHIACKYGSPEIIEFLAKAWPRAAAIAYSRRTRSGCQSTMCSIGIHCQLPNCTRLLIFSWKRLLKHYCISRVNTQSTFLIASCTGGSKRRRRLPTKLYSSQVAM